MSKVKIEIAGKQYNVEIAETEGQRERGLQGRNSLPEDEGMLFIFEDEGTLEF